MSNGFRRTSDGLSAESIGNGRVRRKSVGIRWTSSGSVKYCSSTSILEENLNHVKMECHLMGQSSIYLIIETITILVNRIVVLVKVAVGDRVVPKPTTPG